MFRVVLGGNAMSGRSLGLIGGGWYGGAVKCRFGLSSGSLALLMRC